MSKRHAISPELRAKALKMPYPAASVQMPAVAPPGSPTFTSCLTRWHTVRLILMADEPWPTDEHELQLDKEHYHRRREERRDTQGVYRGYTTGAGGPWLLTAIGTGLLAIGAGLPLLRLAEIWQPPPCASGQQMLGALGTTILVLSLAVFTVGALGLLLCAIIRLANRRTANGRGTGSIAYGSFIAVAAGLGVPQTMLLANALMCPTVVGAA